MSHFTKSNFLLARLTNLQFQRNRGKINIQRPRLSHYERQRVVAVTQPIFKVPPTTSTCFQPNPKVKAAIPNPYNDIIAREVLNWFQSSRMVAVFHMNSISSDDLFNIRVKLHNQNMHLKSYGKKIIEKAVTNTKYANILPLFDSEHCIVFCTEERVAKLLSLTKRTPQMLLLGGIVDNALLSRSEFLKYAKVMDPQAVHAELIQTMNAPAQSLVGSLNVHQTNLIKVLNVMAEHKKTEQ